MPMGSSFIPEEQATLPTIVDNRAATEPERLYGGHTWVDEDGKVQLRALTYHDVSKATDRAAHWLFQRFGRSNDFRTLAYAGPADFRYHLVTMAAAKIGHKALLLSPWNPIIAQRKLLEECNCDTFLAADDDPEVFKTVGPLTEEYPMQVHYFPQMQYLLDGPEVPSYPITKTLAQLHNQIYVVIHTSGSTGYPKAMFETYGAMATQQWLARPEVFFPEGPTTNLKSLWNDACHLMALTPSHASGILGLGPLNVYFNMPMIVPPGDRPFDPDIAAQIFDMEICEAAFMPPSYLQTLARDPDRLEKLRQLKHVIWIGAPFTSAEVADTIRSRVRIEVAYGSAEAGAIALVPEHQDDYEWMHFHDVMGYKMRHFIDDMYELVFVRDAALEKAQFVFQNFPDRDEWETNDLFSKHPTRPDLWRLRGRKDDITVLGTGRNIEPVKLESAVMAHPKVRTALLGGTSRAKTSLLLEAWDPPTTPEEVQSLIEDVWPTIEKANETFNSTGRVQKSMIIIAPREKPFRRAGKGSIQRGRTLEDFSAEIDRLY